MFPRDVLRHFCIRAKVFIFISTFSGCLTIIIPNKSSQAIVFSKGLENIERKTEFKDRFLRDNSRFFVLSICALDSTMKTSLAPFPHQRRGSLCEQQNLEIRGPDIQDIYSRVTDHVKKFLSRRSLSILTFPHIFNFQGN